MGEIQSNPEYSDEVDARLGEGSRRLQGEPCPGRQARVEGRPEVGEGTSAVDSRFRGNDDSWRPDVGSVIPAEAGIHKKQPLGGRTIHAKHGSALQRPIEGFVPGGSAGLRGAALVAEPSRGRARLVTWPGARDIKNKIRSVQNTQKITRAMEMVAASKMRKAQDRMAAARPYAEKMRNVIAHVSAASLEYRHPFLVERENEAGGSHRRVFRPRAVRRAQQQPVPNADSPDGRLARAGRRAGLLHHRQQGGQLLRALRREPRGTGDPRRRCPCRGTPSSASSRWSWTRTPRAGSIGCSWSTTSS